MSSWLVISGIAAALVGLALAAPGDRTTHLVSAGTASSSAFFVGASTDGSRVWYVTFEAIPGTGDTDTAQDIYERTADGTTRLISAGTAPINVPFGGAAADGSRVWYETTEAIPGTGDTDLHLDVYERAADGTTRLISTSTANSFATFRGGSADGSRVWYETAEAIPGTGDTDTASDVYERAADGTTRLISAGTSNIVNGTFRGAAADGSRVWYETTEAIPGTGDTDTANDVYERAADGTTRLISAGTVAVNAVFAGAAADGSRVWYQTAEAIPGTGDGDIGNDVYERAANGTTRLISAGTANTGVLFRRGATDGSRVWYETPEAIPGTGDTDTANDVYERAADGTTRLISAGTFSTDAAFRGAASDGSDVWYTTTEAIPGTGDTDTANDVYERAASGTTRLISAGTANINAAFRGAASDGSRVWYETTEALPSTGDIDLNSDVYERAADDTTRLISAGTANADANFAGAATNGSRTWYSTTETIPATGDSDAAQDVYELRWGMPVVTVAPSVTGSGLIGSPLSCAGEVAVGEGLGTTTRQWLRSGAPVAGATGATYTPITGDEGSAVSCRVSVANPIGAASADSNTIAVTAPPSTALPITPPPVTLERRAVVTGFPIRGLLLTCPAKVTNATASTTAWRRGTRVVGRAARYRIVTADLGKRLTCTVTATGPGGTVTTVSPLRIVPATCRVPRTRGLTLTSARVALGNRACRVRVVRVRGAGVAKGRALGTTPPTGTIRPNGTTITLQLRQ